MPQSDTEREYVQVRTDIAKLTGIVEGNLASLQRSVERHDEEHRAHKLEFDQIHARQNRLESGQAGNTARIDGLEAKSSRAPAWGSLAVSILAVLVAIGGAVAWVG